MAMKPAQLEEVSAWRDAMRYICLCEPKRLLSFEIGRESLLNLAQLTEAYLVTQLERGFATLDFYKTLLI